VSGSIGKKMINDDKTLDLEIVKVTLPMDKQTLKKCFSEKECKYITLIEESKLSVKDSFIYINNLGLPINILASTEKGLIDLVYEYINSTTLLDQPSVVDLVVSFMFSYYGYETELKSVIDFDKIDKKILDAFNRWELLTASLSIFITTNDIFVEKSKYDIIISKDLNGINVVNLLQNENFPLLLLHSLQNKPAVYFEYFFEESIFKGSTLKKFWHNKDNVINIFSNLIFNKESETEELLDLIESNYKTL
jgi:hypothetical protein